MSHLKHSTENTFMSIYFESTLKPHDAFNQVSQTLA